MNFQIFIKNPENWNKKEKYNKLIRERGKQHEYSWKIKMMKSKINLFKIFISDAMKILKTFDFLNNQKSATTNE